MHALSADYTFWNPPPTLLGSLAIAFALFLRARYYFYPEKFSPKATPRMINWLTGIIFIGGLVQVILGALAMSHGK